MRLTISNSYIFIVLHCLLFSGNALETYKSPNDTENSSNVHSRQKRFLYYTKDRRLTFPIGSAIVLGTTFSLPTLRNLPDGYSSKMSISFPLVFKLDALYWTAEENPYGLYPNKAPEEERSLSDIGSMSYLYGVTQKVFDYLGYSGKACFKRAVCELRQGALRKSYGWVKYGLEWILTPSKMQEENNELFSEYHEAEYLGRKVGCTKYHSSCPISIFSSDFIEKKNETSHSRQKRLVFMTTQGLALPPKTGVTFTFVFKCPILQYPPTGYGYDFQFAVPLGVSFDDFGWTSEENPYGTWPDLTGLTKDENRKKRSVDAPKFGSTLHLYSTIASVGERIGYPGKTCLKRAICEMQEGELAKSYGWLRKMLNWLLTPTISGMFSDNLSEYVEAESAGRKHLCHQYYNCTFSIFGTQNEEYRSASQKRNFQEEYYGSDNFIEDSPPNKYQKYAETKNRKVAEEVVSFQETVKIHRMVEQAIRAARLGPKMYTNIM